MSRKLLKAFSRVKPLRNGISGAVLCSGAAERQPNALRNEESSCSEGLKLSA
jgi:hypothetical protein